MLLLLLPVSVTPTAHHIQLQRLHLWHSWDFLDQGNPAILSHFRCTVDLISKTARLFVRFHKLEKCLEVQGGSPASCKSLMLLRHPSRRHRQVKRCEMSHREPNFQKVKSRLVPGSLNSLFGCSPQCQNYIVLKKMVDDCMQVIKARFE